MDTTTLVVTLAFLTLLVVLAVGIVSKRQTQEKLHDGDDGKSTLAADGPDRRD
jgi:hypothetical protein